MVKQHPIQSYISETIFTPEYLYLNRIRKMNSSSRDIEKSRIALGRIIAPLAFWSYQNLESVEKIPDELLIEAVLIHENDVLRRRLFCLYKQSQIKMSGRVN